MRPSASGPPQCVHVAPTAEDVAASAGDENRIVAHVPEHHGSVPDVGERNTLGEVRSRWLCRIAHRSMLPLRQECGVSLATCCREPRSTQ
jgi:hypothetical protein